MPSELAGVVVLYHPDDKVLDNILSYLPWLRQLVVVDNSSYLSPTLKRFFLDTEKILYRGDGINHGMAWALNLGANMALESGCGWLLTMDQDSRFEAGALDTMLAFPKDQQRIGILSPSHVLTGKPCGGSGTVPSKVSCVMTSGNLLSLEAYKTAGPFLEKLFIDYVDYEYCLRLGKFRYQVWVLPEAHLYHSLGELDSHKFLGITFNPTNHSPERRYYMARNRLYVMSTYPSFAVGESWAWTKEIAKLFFFEKGRFLKILYTGKGVWDFIRNRYGSLRRRK